MPQKDFNQLLSEARTLHEDMVEQNTTVGLWESQNRQTTLLTQKVS